MNLSTRVIFCAFYFLGLVMLPMSSWATEKTATYTVTGNNVDQLIEDLNKKGIDGGWGNTKFSWSWSYQGNEKNNIFKVSSVKVETTYTITLPSWKGYDKASKCLKDSWDSMYSSLKKHEKRHVGIGKDVDKKIKEAILKLPGSESEASLKVAVDSAAKGIVDANKSDQDKFDTDTDHGRKDPNDPVKLSPCP